MAIVGAVDDGLASRRELGFDARRRATRQERKPEDSRQETAHVPGHHIKRETSVARALGHACVTRGVVTTRQGATNGQSAPASFSMTYKLQGRKLMTFGANRGARIALAFVACAALIACSSSESNPPP